MFQYIFIQINIITFLIFYESVELNGMNTVTRVNFVFQDLDDIVNQAREAQELEPKDVFFGDDKVLQTQFRQTAIFNQ